MKKILMIAAIAGFGLATFSGCSKSSSSPSYTISAKINGASYSNSNCYFVATGGSLLIESGVPSSSPSYPFMEFSVSNYTGAGTYAISSSSASIYAIDSSATGSSIAQASAAGGSGTLTVTSASSSTISGTFSFTGSDGTTVTGGAFTAKLN